MTEKRKSLRVALLVAGVAFSAAGGFIVSAGIDQMTINEQVKQAEKEKQVVIEKALEQREEEVDVYRKRMQALSERCDELLVEKEEAQRALQERETSRGGIKRPSPTGESRTFVVEASAYNPTNLSVSSGTGLARDGNPAIPYRTVAVDPSVIPLGSVVHVPGWGTGIAHDTGSGIVGNMIDIAVDSDDTAFDWGRRDVEITIEEP